MFGESAVVIIVLYEVGDPDHPEVDAVITLPAVALPVSVTVPPEGATTLEIIGPIFPEYDVELSPALFPALTHAPIVDDDVDVNV